MHGTQEKVVVLLLSEEVAAHVMVLFRLALSALGVSLRQTFTRDLVVLLDRSPALATTEPGRALPLSRAVRAAASCGEPDAGPNYLVGGAPLHAAKQGLRSFLLLVGEHNLRQLLCDALGCPGIDGGIGVDDGGFARTRIFRYLEEV
jgi:hypothetical protein